MLYSSPLSELLIPDHYKDRLLPHLFLVTANYCHYTPNPARAQYPAHEQREHSLLSHVSITALTTSSHMDSSRNLLPFFVTRSIKQTNSVHPTRVTHRGSRAVGNVAPFRAGRSNYPSPNPRIGNAHSRGSWYHGFGADSSDCKRIGNDDAGWVAVSGRVRGMGAAESMLHGRRCESDSCDDRLWVVDLWALQAS